MEAIPTKKANSQVVSEFLVEYIFGIFEVPQKILIDNQPIFHLIKSDFSTTNMAYH